MLVSGFTFVRNGVKLDYPFVESIQSALPLCDEMIVNIGESEDDTEDRIQEIGDPKIRIIGSVWDKNNRKGGTELARQTNKALSLCQGRWCLYLQADEVLHEDDYPALRHAFHEYDDACNVEGLLFAYTHFYGGYQTCYTRNRRFYRNEIRAFKNHLGVLSHGDAQGFRLENRKLRVARVNARVHHYGWARPVNTMVHKTRSIARWWLNDRQLSTYWDSIPAEYRDPIGLEDFTGTHPRTMRKRITADSSTASRSGKAAPAKTGIYRFLKAWLHTLTVGEYRNYRSVKPCLARQVDGPVRRICFVRLRSLGDTLLTTPAFRHLKSALPESHLCLVIESKCADIVKNNPHIDEVFLYHRGGRSLGGLWKLWQRKFDVTIDVLGNARSAIAAFIAGGPFRIGLNERGRRYAYTHRVLGRRYSYVGRQNLEFLRPLGIHARDDTPEVFPGKAELGAAEAFRARHGLIPEETIGLFPTASWSTKMWPSDYFVELGRRIEMDFHKRILVFWGPAERQIALGIQERLGSNALCIPEVDLLTAACLFQGCAAAVGNDSAFNHLATAVRTPTVTIFGPTHPGPWNSTDREMHPALWADVQCRPCTRGECTDMQCMKEVKVDHVFGALKGVLTKQLSIPAASNEGRGNG